MQQNRNKKPYKRHQPNQRNSLQRFIGSLSFSNKLFLSSGVAFIFACVTAFAVFSINNKSTIHPTNSSSYYEIYNNYQQSRLTLDDYANSLLGIPGSQSLGNAISTVNPEDAPASNDLAQLPKLVLPIRPTGEIQVNGAQLADKNGTRYFVAGVNYEGHTDRAWKMWDNGMFDPKLIDSDFALAAAGGYNTLRIFIRDSLRDDIAAGNFSKLDKTVELAQHYGLRLLITFADYEETNLTKLTPIDTAVAKHYVNSPVILGYDQKN